jgi:hypothetical protein
MSSVLVALALRENSSAPDWSSCPIRALSFPLKKCWPDQASTPESLARQIGRTVSAIVLGSRRAATGLVLLHDWLALPV